MRLCLRRVNALPAVGKVWWPSLPLIAIVLTLALSVEIAADTVLKRVVIGMLINVIVVVGLYVFSGNSGILSFGHMGFMLIGAYTSALLTMPATRKVFFLPDLPSSLAEANVHPLLATVVGGAIASVIAAGIGFPLMRLAGIQAAIGTLAVLVIVQVIALNWTSVTGGQTSLIGVPTDLSLLPAAAWAAAFIVLANAYQVSTRGRRLRASREDDIAAASIGIRVAQERRIAFVLSAFVVGCGGGLWAHFAGAFSPRSFYLPLTFVIVVMLVFGGLESLTGAVAGTIIISLLSEVLRRLERGLVIGSMEISAPTGFGNLSLAFLLLLVLVRWPRGVSGGREIPMPHLRGRDAAASIDSGGATTRDQEWTK